MKKISLFLMFTLVLMGGFASLAPRAEAAMTYTGYTDETASGQTIKASSAATALLGININDGGVDENLTQVIVDFTNVSGFTANDLATGKTGVTIYDDSGASSGSFDGTDADIGSTVSWVGLTATINLSATAIPNDDAAGNSGDDFFVVVRTSASITEGNQFTATLGTNSLNTSVTLVGGAAEEVTYTITADTTAPTGTVTLGTATIDEGDLIQEVTVTYDEDMKATSTPTITFGATTGAITTNSDGTWTTARIWNETFDVADGNEESTGVTASSSLATDAAGNAEGTDVEGTFNIDTKAPTAPTVGTFTAVGAPVVAAHINDANTGFTLTFTSPAANYAGTAHLYVGGVEFATPVTILVEAGNTEYTLTGNATSITGLGADGAKALTVVIVDTTGNISSASAASNITLDTAAPTFASVALGADAYVNATDAGTGVNIAITTTGVEDGQTVTCNVTDGSATVGPLTGLSNTNAVTIASTALSALAEGTLTVTCNVSDDAGNAATAGTDTATKDVAAPATPVITSIATDNYIKDSEKGAIHVIGTAESGATVNVSLTGVATVTGSGTATGGNYDITIDGTTLTDGTITPSVTATDAAGNASSAVTTPTATKDVTAPTATAAVSPDAVTANVGDVITVTLTAGGAQADLTVGACTVNSVNVASSFVNATGGSYTLTYTVADGQSNWLSGALPISCVLNEPAGNSVTVVAFDANTLVGDANIPNAPVITSIATNDYINDSEKAAVVIVGTAEANAVISGTLTDPDVGSVAVSGSADGSGDFSITVNATTLDDGTVTLSITAADAAGNVSVAATDTATKDVAAPTLPVSGIVGSTIQAASDTITITFNGPVLPADGTWSSNEFSAVESPNNTAKTLAGATFSPTTGSTTTVTITLAESSTDAQTYLINGSAVAVTPAASAINDAAGNFVANSEIVGTTLNSGDASLPVLSSVVYSQVGGGTITYVKPYSQVLVTATFNEDMTNTPPTITIAAPGTVADVTAQNMSRTSATVWTYTWTVINDATVEGTAALTFAGTDLASNAYVEGGHSIVIDSYAPIVNTFTAGSITTTGATLSVTTNENATCKFASTETAYASMTAMNTTGTTSHSHPLTGLTLGTNYNYYVRCADSSGNTDSSSAHVYFTTLGDTAVPTAPVITTTAATTNSDFYTIAGTVTVDAASTQTVKVLVGANVYGTVIVPKSGTTWSVAVALPQDAATTFKATSTDELGNVSADSNTVVITETQGTGAFGIVSTTMTKLTGTADNTYANGWEWTIRMTLPTSQNDFALKFNNWASGSNAIAVASNMEYYSDQIASGTGSSGTPVSITAADTYPTNITVLAADDVDTTLAGIQTDVHVKVKLPATTVDGSYSTSYRVNYE